MLVDVSAVLMRARLTALSKPDGGVRGIATGTTLRRLVGMTLAKQFAKAPLLWWSSACCGRHPLVPLAQHRRATNAADVNGALLLQVRRAKERTYPELFRSGRCRLVVLAMEKGGRWSEWTVSVIHQLAIARAREVPSYMIHQVALAWERRWTRMLATTTCAISFAASLVEPSSRCESWSHTSGVAPNIAVLMEHDAR